MDVLVLSGKLKMYLSLPLFIRYSFSAMGSGLWYSSSSQMLPSSVILTLVSPFIHIFPLARKEETSQNETMLKRKFVLIVERIFKQKS